MLILFRPDNGVYHTLACIYARMCTVPKDELRRWQASLEQAHAEGLFFASGTGMVVSGRKS